MTYFLAINSALFVVSAIVLAVSVRQLNSARKECERLRDKTMEIADNLEDVENRRRDLMDKQMEMNCILEQNTQYKNPEYAEKICGELRERNQEIIDDFFKDDPDIQELIETIKARENS